MILEDCKGLKRIADIRNTCTNSFITSVREPNGELHQSHDSIANAFAHFHAALHDGSDDRAQADLLGSE